MDAHTVFSSRLGGAEHPLAGVRVLSVSAAAAAYQSPPGDREDQVATARRGSDGLSCC